MQRKIILASTSPRRKELLALTGLDFVVHGSEYEEELDKDLPPHELIAYLSCKKAEDVARHYDDAVILGADTMIIFEGKTYGKPHTKERAQEMLALFSGKKHSIVTGYTIIDTAKEIKLSQTVESTVTFFELSDEEILHYVKTGESLDRAGAYAIQDKGALFVEKIEGDYNNIVGLPIGSVWRDLQVIM